MFTRALFVVTNRLQLLPFGLLVVCFAGQLFAGEGQGTVAAGLSVIEFLPEKFVRDGSVSYQAEIQEAIRVDAVVGRQNIVICSNTLLRENVKLSSLARGASPW